MSQPNVDTTFLTQLGGRTDITEHLNRISQQNEGVYSGLSHTNAPSSAA